MGLIILKNMDKLNKRIPIILLIIILYYFIKQILLLLIFISIILFFIYIGISILKQWIIITLNSLIKINRKN
jgi:hypothetical protein